MAKCCKIRKIYACKVWMFLYYPRKSLTTLAELWKLILSVYIYILLDVLVCNIVVYFYEFCSILTSPQGESKCKERVKICSDIGLFQKRSIPPHGGNWQYPPSPSPDILYKFKTFLDNPHLPLSGQRKFPLWVGYGSFLERPIVHQNIS